MLCVGLIVQIGGDTSATEMGTSEPWSQLAHFAPHPAVTMATLMVGFPLVHTSKAFLHYLAITSSRGGKRGIIQAHK